MKKYYLLLTPFFFINLTVAAQDFGKNLGAAKASYSSGKLADAHFSLEQAIQELDMIVGKEILNMLPKDLNGQPAIEKDDQVSANIGFIGATIHRKYGDKDSQVEIISNSPMIATLNSIMNMPLLGGMMRDSNTKVVKVNGYKCRLEKETESTNSGPSYTLQIPLKSALITITAKETDENKILSFAQTIPIDKIAALIQ
jgi:hypothetical protein